MTEIRKTSRPAESGHWYSRDGVLVETVMGARGQDVRPDIRHARKLGLAPGCTTIIKLQDREALTQWRERQVLMAALTLPRLPDETDESFVDRVLADAKEQAINAAAKGTEIHARIEREINSETTTDEWVLAARHTLWEACGAVPAWRCEFPAVSEYGFATKSDLSYHEMQVPDMQASWVVDIKTKDGDLTDVRCYDDHALQLAATRQALNMDPKWGVNARAGILFMRRDLPEAKFIEVDEAALQRGWRMFACLLRLWQEKTGYRPEWAVEVPR